MYQENRHRNPLIGYEYKEIIAGSDQAAMLVDCYENFGWIVEEDVPYEKLYHHIRIRMKRDRKLVNKMELTRLQRHFEACLNEIKSLELAKTRDATVCSMIVGIVGTAFLAGSVFSIIRVPPMIWLCILLAIPGFIGWILPYFIYQRMYRDKVRVLQPMIEEKINEIYVICEKGNSLL